MRYADITPGMHIIRTRELAWARQLSGVICLVHPGAVPGKMHIQLTSDCVPVGGVLAIGKEADDGYWYDVSELISEANSVILPSGSENAYAYPAEVNYRNYIGCDKLMPFVGNEAAGQICLIGERQQNGRTIFSKTGYYVVGVDVNGYAAVYQGYCDYVGGGSNRKLSLRILNLSNTDRAFYRADEIVRGCGEAFRQDCLKADDFRKDIMESIVASSTESDVNDMVRGQLNYMALEEQ